jgi:nucleoside permease NupC
MKRFKKILINITLIYLYAIMFLWCLWLGTFAWSGIWSLIETLICNYTNMDFCLLKSYGSYDGFAFTIRWLFLLIIPCTLIFFYIFYQIIQYITRKIEKNLKK